MINIKWSACCAPYLDFKFIFYIFAIINIITNLLKHKNMTKSREEINAYYRQKYAENPQKTIERTSNYLNNTPMGRACRLVNNYNWMDKKANRGKGNLTPKWIVENIFTKPCAHCGKTGWNVIGCNRIDNSKPHTMDNVEPCCEHCNHVLGGKLKALIVDQIDPKTGEVLHQWESASEAEIQLGYNSSHINACCLGKRKTHKGYIWKRPL